MQHCGPIDPELQGGKVPEESMLSAGPGHRAEQLDVSPYPHMGAFPTRSYPLHPGPDMPQHPSSLPKHDSFVDQRPDYSRRSERSYMTGPPSLRTMSTSASMPESLYRDRADTDSPTYQSHPGPMLGMPSQSSYPTLKHDSLTAGDALSASSRPDRLPSFRQLSKIADAGTDATDSRTVPFPPLTTYQSGLVSQSPGPSHPQFPPSQQSSPSNSFIMLGQHSPTSTRADMQDPLGAGSSSYTASRGTSQRRRSFGSAKAPPFLSHSSGDTIGSHQSSSTEGFSTTHTTPIESSVDGTPKPPSHHGHYPNPVSGVFICEYPGCNAPPFQTQYLLNSHANVHSSARPHYCPVKGCPRAEGGKGFKRKNEMIRHGLVHDSPGYICPFCPLREHKYPRPDNLQRHVRVHHVDKEKDDPLLREVLAQRPEGGSRGRRRRTGP